MSCIDTIPKNKANSNTPDKDSKKHNKNRYNSPTADSNKDKTIHRTPKDLTYSQEILGTSSSIDETYSKVIKDFFVKHINGLKNKKVNKNSIRNFFKNCKNALHVKKPPKRKGYAKLITDEEKR